MFTLRVQSWSCLAVAYGGIKRALEPGLFILIFVLLMCSLEHYSWHRCVNPFNSSFSGVTGSGTWTGRLTSRPRSGTTRWLERTGTTRCLEKGCLNPGYSHIWPSFVGHDSRIGSRSALKAFKPSLTGSTSAGRRSSKVTSNALRRSGSARNTDRLHSSSLDTKFSDMGESEF